MATTASGRPSGDVEIEARGLSEGTRPLDGVRVLEFASLAPAPLCAMLLANFGADVTVVERPGYVASELLDGGPPLFSSGKRGVLADLKDPADLERVLALVDRADVLIEGNRPGVMERLGLGPDDLLGRNPRLVYTRLTGWGQEGPYAQRAGHDINYIAIAGALAQVGVDEPVPPCSFVGDFGGGSFLATMGVLLALRARDLTGEGQVVDAAIVDGAATLMSAQLEMHSRGLIRARGENTLEGRAPFYGVYRCADGRWYSVGALEPQFYDELLARLGLAHERPADQHDPQGWAELREKVAAVFATRTSEEWERELGATDTCTAPVLEIEDLHRDPHLQARDTYRHEDGQLRAAAAPRLSRTPGRIGAPYVTSEPGP